MAGPNFSSHVLMSYVDRISDCPWQCDALTYNLKRRKSLLAVRATVRRQPKYTKSGTRDTHVLGNAATRCIGWQSAADEEKV